MSEYGAEKGARIGDRVRLWIGPPKRGGWRYGTVTGIDNGHRPGLDVTFDAPVLGQPTCYATHAEVEVIARVTPSEPTP